MVKHVAPTWRRSPRERAMLAVIIESCLRKLPSLFCKVISVDTCWMLPPPSFFGDPIIYFVSMITSEIFAHKITFDATLHRFSESYIKSVASKPYSKDLSQRRPLDYSIEKLSQVLQWRQEAGAADLIDFIHLANGPENSPEALANPEQLTKAKAVATALNTASQYWHGFTKDGRPIFWVRTNRKFWYPDVEAELKALILLTDAGIRTMPEGTTEFVVVSDSTSPPPPNPNFMIGMLKGLVRGYPDRLGLLVSAPVSSIIQFVMKLLLPLMPGRLSSKVLLYDMDRMVAKLEEILPNGKDGIPTFFGGAANHDEFYPEDAYSKNQGQGSLTFDYFGMVERLEAARDEWIATKKQD